jgi:hypothetical protein
LESENGCQILIFSCLLNLICVIIFAICLAIPIDERIRCPHNELDDAEMTSENKETESLGFCNVGKWKPAIASLKPI